jgi:hypothetical protein
MRRRALLFGLAGIALAAGLCHAAAAVTIAPHRAVYTMELVRGGDSAVAAVDGTMLFEWADSCDGWTVQQRWRLLYLYNTGEEVEVSQNLTSWESKDGLRYRFFIRRMQNGEVASELRGEARIDEPGGAGTATYTLPEKRVIELPPGTLFPTAHSLKLIERAEAGDTLVYAIVFDGSDEDGLFDVSAALGPRTPPAGETATEPLAAGPSWTVSLAFYLTGKEAVVPEHEQFVRMYANGVVDSLLIDYGDYTVDAQLKKVEALPPQSC